MRRFKMLLLLAASPVGGCLPTVCCDVGDGPQQLLRSECSAAGADALSLEACQEVLFDPQGGDVTSCQAFCGEILEACPTDDLCFQQCILQRASPDEAVLDCARAAESCSETYACWTLFLGTPR